VSVDKANNLISDPFQTVFVGKILPKNWARIKNVHDILSEYTEMIIIKAAAAHL
jgi:hypothetical protein